MRLAGCCGRRRLTGARRPRWASAVAVGAVARPARRATAGLVRLAAGGSGAFAERPAVARLGVGAAASAGARPRRCFATTFSSGNVGRRPISSIDPSAARAVGRLALLPVGQHRRGDEDRRVGAGQDADPHREGEVLERRAAEDVEHHDQEHASSTPVISDRVRTSLIDLLAIWENAARGIRGTFSRIRSNTITVSYIE